MEGIVLYVLIVAVIAIISYLFLFIVVGSAFIDFEKHSKEKILKWAQTIGLFYYVSFVAIALFFYINDAF